MAAVNRHVEPRKECAGTPRACCVCVICLICQGAAAIQAWIHTLQLSQVVSDRCAARSQQHLLVARQHDEEAARPTANSPPPCCGMVCWRCVKPAG